MCTSIGTSGACKEHNARATMITPEYFREKMPGAQVVFVYDPSDIPEECTVTNYATYQISYGSK